MMPERSNLLGLLTRELESTECFRLSQWQNHADLYFRPILDQEYVGAAPRVAELQSHMGQVQTAPKARDLESLSRTCESKSRGIGSFRYIIAPNREP